jgi:hypothetical protein
MRTNDLRRFKNGGGTLRRYLGCLGDVQGTSGQQGHMGRNSQNENLVKRAIVLYIARGDNGPGVNKISSMTCRLRVLLGR